MADRSILDPLAGVRVRQRITRAARWAAVGFVPSAVVAVALAAVRAAGSADVSVVWIVAAAAIGPVLGGLAGMLRPARWGEAAAAVDAHYGLKDRSVSALSLGERPVVEGDGDGGWGRLQRADAAAHLDRVRAGEVVPFRWTRRATLAAGLAGLVVVLAVWPAPEAAVASVATPNADLQRIAGEVEEQLDTLEEETAADRPPEIEELLAELREHLEEMKRPETDAREALAELSRMEAAVRQHAEYDEAAVAANLETLAGAMEAAEALRAVALELKAGDLERAAESLDALDPSDAPRRERKAAADRMKRAAAKMAEAGQKGLAGAAAEMGEGLGSGDGGKTGAAAKKLASLLREHDARRKLNRSLCKQLDRLAECKSKCSSCLGKKPCSKCGSSLCDKPGSCDKNSLGEGPGKKSDRPSTNYGMTTAGNLDDAATELAANRNREELTGTAGDGPSEYETSNSPEGEETARRGYAETHAEFQKRSEEVLEGEQIPLGHRQLIRTYFERIRPSAGDTP